MRKVLSFVLVLALVLGSFSMAFAATPSDVVGTPSQDAVEVLMGLGIVDGYPDGTFKPAGIVTRAEMAKLIVVALGLEDYAVGMSKYPDMAGATWAQGYVNYATALGVIEGYPDGTFGPSRTVTYAEAATMIVRALGYTDDSLPGMWPANYVVKAKTLGILDGIKSAMGGANRGDIAIMLYNALNLEIGFVNKDGDWSANDDDDNMLMRLGAEEYMGGDEFLVKGDEDTAINLRPFVGAWATAYTMDDEIIVLDPVSTFLSGYNQPGDKEFEADGVVYKISNTAIANENSLTQDIFMDGSTYEGNDFFNGEFEPYTSRLHQLDTRSSASPYTIAVELDGKTITQVYSVAAWAPHDESDMPTTGEIAKADLKDIADDMMLFDVDFIQTDDEEIDMNSFDLVGVDSLSDIKVGDIVYVYPGFETGDVRRIAVGTEEVTGKVTRINSDGDEFVIGGKTFDLSHWFDGWTDGAVPADDFDIALGETGTAMLDFAGNVYSWTVEDKTADNYAIVLATAPAISVLDDDRVKLLTKAGDEVVYDVNSDADGTALSALALGDLVVFSTDSDGNVDNIVEKTWVTPSGNNALSANRTLYNNQLVDAAVVVFTVDGSDFDVAKLTDVETGMDLSAPYYMDDTKVNVMLVDVDYAAATSDSIYAFINTVDAALNADDDEVQDISGVSAGAAFSALTTSDSGVDAASTPAALYMFSVDADDAVTVDDVLYGDYEDLTVLDVDGWNLLLDDMTDMWVEVEAAAFVVKYDISAGEYTVSDFDSIDVDDVVTVFQVSDDSVDNDTYDYVVYTVE